MAGTIATFLADASTINTNEDSDQKGQQRHAYKELLDLQAVNDPALASPYLAASANSVIAANGGASGNLTITMNFPKAGVAKTTGNIAYNASVATVQTAIDAALAGETIGATYVADDVKASGAGIISGNALTLTANGTSVNTYNMVVTTANAGDLSVNAPAVTAGVVGTGNRPAEALLAQQSVVTPLGTITAQGDSPSEGDYLLGDNPRSLSPGLQEIICSSIQRDEDKTIGDFIRDVVGCVQ